MRKRKRDSLLESLFSLRSLPDLNRSSRFCRPVPSPSAKRPYYSCFRLQHYKDFLNWQNIFFLFDVKYCGCVCYCYLFFILLVVSSSVSTPKLNAFPPFCGCMEYVYSAMCELRAIIQCVVWFFSPNGYGCLNLWRALVIESYIVSF